MPVNVSDPKELTGATVTGEQDTKLGKVDAVYLDNETQRPEWVAVSTGMFGSHVSLVPLAEADYRDGVLHLPYSKDQVRNAPHQDPDKQLSGEDEKQLFDHYNVGHGRAATTGTAPGETGSNGRDSDQGGREQHADTRGDQGRGQHATGDAGTVGHDTSGPTTDEAMTRSEEQLRVGTETQESGRARLRKYVVTEEQTVTVPVSHEEVRVEREPITDANAGAAHDGPAISEEEHEVVLHEERPVVEKQTVAQERVRLNKDTHTDQEQVSEQVRKEQVETDGAIEDRERGER
jgi:uncharacterized protein (TIGR02271 family)